MGPEPEFLPNQGLSTSDWLSSWRFLSAVRPSRLIGGPVESLDSMAVVLGTWLYYALHRGCAGTRDLNIGVSIVCPFPIFSYIAYRYYCTVLLRSLLLIPLMIFSPY